jgi:hypothetical protein
MKTKRAILTALIVVCTIGVGTTTASAGQPVAGCTNSFQLAKASKFPDQTIDRNGDGWVCAKTIPTPPPNNNVIDNTSSH